MWRWRRWAFASARTEPKRVFERKGARERERERKRGETSFANGIYSAEKKAEKVGKRGAEREEGRRC